MVLPSASGDIPRKYRSPLRNEQAAQTHQRILKSAATLFATTGYVGTSLAQIADHAGVSVETVKLVGPKRSLILAAFESEFAGTDGATHIVESRRSLATGETSDGQAFLTALIEFIANSNRRMGALWPSLQNAAEVDDIVKAAFTEMQASRRAEFRLTIAAMAKRGLIGATQPEGELADALSFLLSPESYLQLVRDAGWSFDHYVDWLHRAVRAAVLTP